MIKDVTLKTKLDTFARRCKEKFNTNVEIRIDGDTIREARQNNGLSIRELADKIKIISSSQISNLENGNTLYPKLEVVIELDKVFHLNYDKIMIIGIGDEKLEQPIKDEIADTFYPLMEYDRMNDFSRFEDLINQNKIYDEHGDKLSSEQKSYIINILNKTLEYTLSYEEMDISKYMDICKEIEKLRKYNVNNQKTYKSN